MREGGLTMVAGMDEVGRGALAGPVSVGVVAVRADTATAPRGLHDSKLLTPAQRERLEPRIMRWAPAWAVGHAGNDEIDAWGILAALRLAGLRALRAVAQTVAQSHHQDHVDHVDHADHVHHVVLDGSYDWLTRPPLPARALTGDPQAERVRPTVQLVVRADQRCAAVAAASVLAKVARDRLMVSHGQADPRYGWAGNKGYAAPEHAAALRRHGPCELHRRSWNLLGRPPELPGQDVLVVDIESELISS